LPYVPLAVVLGLCAGEALVTDPLMVDNVVFWIGAGLIALLLVRQGIVIVENTRLARSLAMSNERLQYQVLHDLLTSLPNRPLFIDRLRMALARMSRVDELVAIMFVDLDRFKPVNDTYGHEAGDLVLVTLGRRLSAAVRTGDTVARFGGDEFLVLCEDVSSAEEAVALANRMVETMAEPIVVGDIELVVSASLGLVVTDAPDADAEELVRQADRAMYEAKAKGRARVELVDARRKSVVV
jgi:diguanylate cyclase (GGDEF)-like protein